ncbi:hypothetical protein [Aporhodopirellula aestuarii]|uniref:Uncharacterized protein n=1 Tax=Aporhodopirellula aestuarii TaxID=2950107 RepID=A0ABT0UBT2_9BACT|nr:hypothetical protein [Aporhodopirellula aestuarii]MCM2373796.1 hypothetical protein [Aporhodopirellula aestuarii]
MVANRVIHVTQRKVIASPFCTEAKGMELRKILPNASSVAKQQSVSGVAR